MKAVSGRSFGLGSLAPIGVFLALLASPAHAALFPDLANRVLVGDPNADNPFGETEGPKDVAAGDLNGDGRADIVTANLDGSISVLLGTASGKIGEQILCPAVGLLAKSSLRSVAVADFTGDGKNDVAVADIYRGGVVFAWGNGDGTLTPALRVPCPFARSLATADIDEDGFKDVLVASSPADCEGGPSSQPADESTLSVIRATGAGTFDAPRLIHKLAWGCFYEVALVDINGDGHVEALALDLVSRAVLLLAGDGKGNFGSPLALVSEGHGPRDFAVGYLDEQLVGGAPPAGATLDIVIANRDGASLTIFLGKGNFAFTIPETIPSGDARAVAAGDLDGDGIAELVITNRYTNMISIFHGFGGARYAEVPMELPTGTSPREIVFADLTGDGALDAAVNNRVSGDVSIFIGRLGVAAFLVPGSYYVAGLSPSDVVAADFNGDGYPDAASTSLRSHDIQIRLNDGAGGFGPDLSYLVNYEPASVAAGDLNGDGRADLVAACLGAAKSREASMQGSIVALLGNGDGTFTPAPVVDAGVSFRPKWVRLGDLSGDGILDAAIGCASGEVVLRRGRGDGAFDPAVVFATEGAHEKPISVTLGDFTGDGKIDIATSRCQILVNDGNFFTGPWAGEIRPFTVKPPDQRMVVETWFIDSADLDRDGHRDIMLALSFRSPDPIAVFYNNGDGTFGEPTIYEGPDMGVVALAVADMDGDGILDIAVGNRCAATVIIMRGKGDRTFERLEDARTYSVEALAVADLNLDGRPDLLGVGLGLWALLNGGSMTLVPPSEHGILAVPRRDGVFINEIMAANDDFFVENGDASPDWIELYNYDASAADLSGQILRKYDRNGTVRNWTFAEGTIIPAFERFVVFFGQAQAGGPAIRSTWCSAFGLSRDGEGIALLDRHDGEIDRVDFPALPPDVSYARFFDGAPYLCHNPVPTLGIANVRPANLEPRVDPETPAVSSDGTAVDLVARTFDDTGIALATASYRVRGSQDFTQVLLSDDGRHGDGAAGDGVFGMTVPDLTPGTTIEYFLRVIDFEGCIDTTPGDPTVAIDLLRFTMPSGPSPLRLSEVISDNESGYRDETGAFVDWVEIVNCSDAPASLDGLALGKDYFDRGAAWRFPAGVVVAPGACLVVSCDKHPERGPLHADFRLNREGDQVLLIRAGVADAWILLDRLSFGALPADTAFGIPACGAEPRVLDRPTPGVPNGSASVRFVRADANGDGRIDIADPIATLGYLFGGRTNVACLDACDANDSGNVDIGDAVYVLGYVFAHAIAPQPPFPACGIDETLDDLNCSAFARCP